MDRVCPRHCKWPRFGTPVRRERPFFTGTCVGLLLGWRIDRRRASGYPSKWRPIRIVLTCLLTFFHGWAWNVVHGPLKSGQPNFIGSNLFPKGCCQYVGPFLQRAKAFKRVFEPGHALIPRIYFVANQQLLTRLFPLIGYSMHNRTIASKTILARDGFFPGGGGALLSVLMVPLPPRIVPFFSLIFSRLSGEELLAEERPQGRPGHQQCMMVLMTWSSRKPAGLSRRLYSTKGNSQVLGIIMYAWKSIFGHNNADHPPHLLQSGWEMKGSQW